MQYMAQLAWVKFLPIFKINDSLTTDWVGKFGDITQSLFENINEFEEEFCSPK